MVKVVVINGMPGCGKTTFEQMCSDICDPFAVDSAKHISGFTEGRVLGVDICSTVDFVKVVARHCGWDGTKDLKNRKFLSDLKDLLTEWDDVPFKRIQIRANVRAKSGADIDWILFVDCREPVEIQKLKERLNATTVLIRRPQIENNETSNHADSEVFNYKYDLEIWNESGLDDLKKLAESFIEYMKKEEVPYYVNAD